MLKLVNYNKGATVLALRNTQIIAVLCMFIAPIIFYLLNKYLLHLPERYQHYIIVATISVGIVVYVASVAGLLVTLLNTSPLHTRPQENTEVEE